MLGLTLLVASIAIADSINPSTVIPALWLAGGSSTGRLASYTLGVFLVYLAGGIVLLFGPGQVAIGALHHIQGSLEHVLQAVGGAVALAVAFVLWRSRARAKVDDQPRTRRAQTRTSAFALGAGIMAIELPTAFMYFGAISAILAARPAAPLELSLLLLYNALFVAPLIAFLAFRRLAGTRADHWLSSVQTRLRYLGQVALTAVAAAAGAALLAVGLNGLFVA